MLELYSAKNSSGFAALVCLEELGVEYKLTPLDLAAREHKLPAFLAINPRGLVPALAADDIVITEVIGVLTYIAATRPEDGLVPSTTTARAKLYELLAWFSTTVHVAAAQVFRSERYSDDPASHPAIAERGRARFGEAVDHFEALAARGGPWLLGEAFTLADAVGLVAWRWKERLLPGMEGAPAWAAMIERTLARPAVQRALAVEARLTLRDAVAGGGA